MFNKTCQILIVSHEQWHFNFSSFIAANAYDEWKLLQFYRSFHSLKWNGKCCGGCWGVGGLLLFQAAKWGSGLLYFDVALRFCHFKYFFNHKLTHAHTHTHVHRERGRVVRIQSLIHKLIHMAIPIFQANLLQLAASGLPTK